MRHRVGRCPLRVRLRLRVSGALLVGVVLAASGPVRAQVTDDEAEIGRRLQQVLREHGGEIYGCYGKRLVEQPKLAGELLLRIYVGSSPTGAVMRAEVLKDQVGSSALGVCLVDAALSWRVPSLAGAAPEVRQLVFPLVFKPDGPGPGAPPPTPAPAPAASPAATPSPAAAASAPGPGPGELRFVVPLAMGQPGPIGAGKVDARVLIDESTVGPTQASLTHLTLRATARLAIHTHPAAEEVFFVVKGIARLRTAKGGPEVANAGDVIVAAAGAAHNIESAPLAPLVLLQFFAPAGAERAYRNPTDATAREGTVPVRTRGTGAQGLARIIHANEARTYPLPGGKGTVDLFLDGVAVKVALEKIDARPGAEIPIHTHDGSDELLYILQGRGEMTVGEKTLVVSAGDAIHIPQYTPHGLKVSEHVIAVQVYAPRGPEQRFKTTH